MKTAALAVAAMMAVSLTLAGCAGGGGTTPTDSTGDTTLTLALASAPVSLDPSKAATGLYSNYVETTYASLLGYDTDGNIVAGLADEWGYVGEGNTEFQVTLRDGVTWADGTPITADDVVASLEYFAAGTGPTAPNLAGFTFAAVDDATVSITSPAPNPEIADLLTPQYLAGAIISPEGLADPAALGENTFGAGQYVLDTEKTVSGDTYAFVPNENYWDQDSINYDSITIRVIANTNSAVQALKSGQVDFIAGTPDAAAAVAGDDSIVVDSTPAIWTGVYLLDRDGTVVPALKDVRVRQALNYAVDRDVISEAVYGDFGEPIDQTAVPGFDGFSDASADTYTYDPDKAKELLADAGYASGLTIPVNYGSFDPDNTKLIQAVQSQLAEVGVTLELTAAQNFGGWVDNLVSMQNAGTVLSPGSGGSQFYITQSTFMPGGIMNVFNVENAEVSAAFATLATAPEDEHDAAAAAVSDVVVDQALALPISSSDTIVIYSDKLQGLDFIKGTGLPAYVTSWSSK